MNFPHPGHLLRCTNCRVMAICHDRNDNQDCSLMGSLIPCQTPECSEALCYGCASGLGQDGMDAGPAGWRFCRDCDKGKCGECAANEETDTGSWNHQCFEDLIESMWLSSPNLNDA